MTPTSIATSPLGAAAHAAAASAEQLASATALPAIGAEASELAMSVVAAAQAAATSVEAAATAATAAIAAEAATAAVIAATSTATIASPVAATAVVAHAATVAAAVAVKTAVDAAAAAVSVAEQTALHAAFALRKEKAMAQALHTALNDKAALLREVHHRVKNNLQVIVSLLRLEAGRSAHANTRVVLQDMQMRIRSMALLHESLLQSRTLAWIELAKYVGDLASEIYRGRLGHPASIELRLALAEVRVGMDQAVVVGLLLNELVSNSLRHGFPDGRSGVLQVQLEPVPGGALWRLGVSDTGVGLAPDFAQRRVASLGMQLIGDLVLQIDGVLDIRSEAGVGSTFSVSFQPELPAPHLLSAPRDAQATVQHVFVVPDLIRKPWIAGQALFTLSCRTRSGIHGLRVKPAMTGVMDCGCCNPGLDPGPQ